MIGAAAVLFYAVVQYDDMLPSTCMVNAPFSCVEYKVADNGDILLGILASQGDVADVVVTFHCFGAADVSSPVYSRVSAQERLGGGYVLLQCPVSGKRYSAPFEITYRNADETVSHTAKGRLKAAIERS